jgi:hypothetical protein
MMGKVLPFRPHEFLEECAVSDQIAVDLMLTEEQKMLFASGSSTGGLKLIFHMDCGRIEVEVKSIPEIPENRVTLILTEEQKRKFDFLCVSGKAEVVEMDLMFLGGRIDVELMMEELSGGEGCGCCPEGCGCCPESC